MPLGPPAARAQPLDLPAVSRSGSARRHRMAGGGRSHGRHHSRPCRKLAFLSATISTMSQRPSIRIPRWIQLVGLPVLLLVAWALAGTLGHAIFLFLTASVIAFLLNPLVRALQGLRIRRGFARRRGLPLVRGCDDRGHRRARHRRRRADALGGRPGRRLPYGRARTQRRQRLRPRRRRSRVLAARPRHRRPAPRPGRRVDRGRQRLRPDPGGDLVRRRRGVRLRPAALLDRPDRRHRGLHAARHAEAGSDRSTGASHRTAATR